jgi:Sec-independent protein secretion pathway component TatC
MVTANRWPWIAGLVGCFALAAIFTPADPASMLLVAVPLSVVYGLAVAVRRIPRMRSGGGKPPSKLENA